MTLIENSSSEENTEKKTSIEVINLSAWYGNKTVFDNLNFKLESGTFTALCGKNGAGKSTLLSLLDGIVPDGMKYSGEILVNGKNVFKLKRSEIARQISYLVQSEMPVWNLTVKDFIETGLYASERINSSCCDKAVLEACKTLGIEGFLSKNIFNISGGEFQKCRLARCLVQKNSIFLFDEPAENLDLPFQLKFLKQIKDTQKENTVLFSIHDINTAALFADQFILFSENNVITGTSETIFDAAVLEKAYSAEARIYSHPEFAKPQVCFLIAK